MGLSDKTVRSYLDILTGTYMVRQVQPWFENIRKRQVKALKVYIRDSGILHSLLRIDSYHSLLGHPELGASWEGFVIEQIVQTLSHSELYFWKTHTGAELDIMFIHTGKRYGIEIKFNEAPKMSRSMHASVNTLNLKHLWIVYPGPDKYPIHEKVTVYPITELPNLSDEFI